MTERYPLDDLERLREHAEGGAVEAYAAALEARARAEAARIDAAERLQAHLAYARQPTKGRATGAALRADAAHRARERERDDALAAALARAEEAEVRSEAEVARTRAALADAAAERAVVERHRARWEGARRRAKEKAEEREG